MVGFRKLISLWFHCMEALLHQSQCLLGKAEGMHAKNSAGSTQEEKKLKEEKDIVGRGKERQQRAKKFMLVPHSQQFQALHEIQLEFLAATRTNSFLFCISEPLSPSHRCAREWGGEDS